MTHTPSKSEVYFHTAADHLGLSDSLRVLLLTPERDVKVQVAIADVDVLVPKGSPADRHAARAFRPEWRRDDGAAGKRDRLRQQAHAGTARRVCQSVVCETANQ